MTKATRVMSSWSAGDDEGVGGFGFAGAGWSFGSWCRSFRGWFGERPRSSGGR